MDILTIVLRFLHIFAGVFWMGAVFMSEVFLIPTARATGPAGMQFMGHLVRAKKYPVRVVGAAIVTVLAGLGLYWHNVAISNGAWAQTRAAMIYGIGGAAAILALFPGIVLVARSATALAELGASIQASGAQPSAEQQAQIATLQRRIANGTHAAAGLTGIALLCMAIARYF